MKVNSDILRVWLIIATVVYGVTAMMALAFYLILPMMFDAPGSEENTALVAFATCIVIYPFLSVIAVALGWILRKKAMNTAFIITLLPLLDAILAFVFAVTF